MATRPDFKADREGKTDELKEELGKLGQVAKDAAYEQMEHLREQGMERARQLEDRISEQPLKSVLIAAGVGFLMGMLWNRD